MKSFSWTVGVQEPECGQAEFYGLDTTSGVSAFVVNSRTPLANGVMNVSAYNPKHKELSWVQNTRINKIDLLYRKSATVSWLPALNGNGDPAEFYDDVSVYTVE
jgi:hypothetical protein